MNQSDRVPGLVITGGTFTDVHGSYYHVQNSPQESGIHALSRAISHGAMYDSAVRYPAGRCHSGTRKEIIRTILEWICNPSPTSNVLWLYGPAGSGKSAVMQTIAEILRTFCKERYGGSFFFARRVPGQDEGDALFSTLAYQLATNLPAMREHINQAMVIDITLPTKSMEAQLHSLLIQTFKACSNLPVHTPTIIIDGLDECGDSRSQRTILSLIAKAISTARLPLRFLIASRPEFWIRDTFDQHPLRGITQRLNLSDSRYNAYQDIQRYLEDGFNKIYERNLDILCHVPKPWPSKEIIGRLTYNASGQFIYASTVLKFVGDFSDFSDPQKQLGILFTPGPLRAVAFLDLDQLYLSILFLYPRRDTLIQVLGGLLAYPYPKFLETYLDIDASEFCLVLRAISSIIQIQKKPYFEPYEPDDEDLGFIYGFPEEEIKFHLSFREFLIDNSRSGPFSIDIQAVFENLFPPVQQFLIGTLNGRRTRDLGPMKIIFNLPYHQLFGQFSLVKLALFINNLRLALQEFSRCRTSVQVGQLLMHMRYLQTVVGAVRNWVGNDIEAAESIFEEILRKIDAVKDECIQEMLYTSDFPVLQHIAYVIGERGPLWAI